MKINNVLLVSMFTITCLCKNLYLNKQISLKEEITQNGLTVGYAPQTVQSYFGEFVDIALCSQRGEIYFYNKKYAFQYVSKAIDTSILFCRWGQLGIQFGTSYKAKIVDPKLYQWTIFQLEFSRKVYDVVFSFDKERNLFLTAVSFYSSLKLYENQTAVAQFQLYYTCYAMAFHPNGKHFYFVASMIYQSEQNNYFMHSVDLETKKIIGKSEFIYYDQKLIVFVNKPGYQNFSITAGQKYLYLWNGYVNLTRIQINKTVNKLLFTQNSEFLILDMGNQIGLIKVDFTNQLIIDSSSEIETYRFQQTITDIATNRNRIIVITSYSNLWSFGLKDETELNGHGMFVMLTNSFYIFLLLGIFSCCICTQCYNVPSKSSSSSRHSRRHRNSFRGGNSGGGGGITRHNHG